MKCTVWDSAAVQPASEFDYYQSGLCTAFAHLTPFKPAAGAKFSAKMEHWVGCENEFTYLQTVSHRVMRSKHDISHAEDNNIYLNFIERGELRLEQNGERAILKRGDLAIIDNAKPFDVQINAQSGHRHLAFRINATRNKINATSLVRRLNGHALTPALRNAVSYLGGANANWVPERVAKLAVTIENLASMIVAEHDQPETFSRAKHTTLMVKSQIDRHFSLPEYSLEDAGRSLSMPTRSLQNHLQICGTSFSSLLMNARLSYACEQLRHTRKSVEDICYDSGFQDLSTFYRAFKARYSIAPGAYKNHIAQ
jgi:AraC family transcriptional regulator, positive regulator of tynA and feaB